MNGVYAFLAPILLLLSVISFVIHFRNERKKTLIERPFHAAKDSGKREFHRGCYGTQWWAGRTVVL